MKKIFIIIVICTLVAPKSFACGGGDYIPDSEYYGLFMQEIVGDPVYYPFLYSLNSAYYSSSIVVENENIQEWQKYLNLTYDQTFYLVFKSSEKDIRKIIDNKPIDDKNLAFINTDFARKYKQALLYLAYAKYLEPYMTIKLSTDNWNYYSYEDVKTADKLNYKKTTNVLIKSWNAETDKELKLRYGYQLVRFAHYNRNYEDAVSFFDTYVESLQYKPAIYYHALSQKAGALSGLGEIQIANYLFLKVFVNSKNLKEIALNSIKFSSNGNFDYENLIKSAKTQQEINDVNLMFGFLSFNNPLNALKRITEKSPDAIQAKILMARAINSIEREIPFSYYETYKYENLSINDKRFPIIAGQNPKLTEYFNDVLNFSKEMIKRTDVKDKNFWNISAAYLLFLNKDFDKASEILSKVNDINQTYVDQKKKLAMLIDICKYDKITNDVETKIFEKYEDLFENKYESDGTLSFILDVLANRYFLQGDYAKSFLVSNELPVITRNPQIFLLDELEIFYKKTNKNNLEKYIAKHLSSDGNVDAQSYINDVRGIVYLSKGDFTNAMRNFQNMSEYSYEISNKILGYNKIECFDCDEDAVMGIDYLTDFSFEIPNVINEKELTNILIKLNKEAISNTKLSAKANYLLGNFFYNISKTGYYRHIPCFGTQSHYEYEKYEFWMMKYQNQNIFNNIYFKNYDSYYDNTYKLADKYLQNAYNTTSDNELKARIAFALSKCEQEEHYENYSTYTKNMDYVMIKDRQYFKALATFKNTKFYKEVKSNCLYFDYYTTNY